MEYLSVLTKDAGQKLAFSISRVWQHANQNSYPIAMITAFRKEDASGKELTLLENRIRNQKLVYDLRALNYPYVQMEGHYIENYKEENEEDVTEESFFVIGKDKNIEEFVNNLYELGVKYEQDSVIIKTPDSKDAFLLGTKATAYPGLGVKEYVGDFHPRQINRFYSKWKKRDFSFTHLGKELTGKSGVTLQVMHENEKRKLK